MSSFSVDCFIFSCDFSENVCVTKGSFTFYSLFKGLAESIWANTLFAVWIYKIAQSSTSKVVSASCDVKFSLFFLALRLS